MYLASSLTNIVAIRGCTVFVGRRLVEQNAQARSAAGDDCSGRWSASMVRPS